MTHPLITIGMTSYNAQDTIERAVRSAILQSWPHTEIVIVDDASDDSSFEVLEALQKDHPDIRIFIMEKNGGVAAARNKIIEEAKGDFIAFFDDDDISESDRLTKQYQRIIHYEEAFANHDPVICHTARMQIYPDGKQHYETTMGINDGMVPHGPPVAERILFGRPVPHIFGSTATCSQMARTQTYRNLNGFDQDFRRSEDTDFNIRAALKGAHFVGIREALVQQTMTKASDKTLGEERKYFMKLLKKHEEFISKHMSYKFCKIWAQAKYDFLARDYLTFLKNISIAFFTSPLSTIKRFIWAIPNSRHNLKSTRFYNEHA